MNAIHAGAGRASRRPSARSGAHHARAADPARERAAQPERQRPPDRRSTARRARSAAPRPSAAARAGPCGPRRASRRDRRSARRAPRGSPPGRRRRTPRASGRGASADGRSSRAGAALAEHVQRRPRAGTRVTSGTADRGEPAITRQPRQVAARAAALDGAPTPIRERATTREHDDQQGQRQDQRERARRGRVGAGVGDQCEGAAIT